MYTGTVEEIIQQFCEKENWGMSPNETTATRFAKELDWLREMVKEYAEFFGMTPDEMIAEFESKRDYSFPNYYQPANFPSLKRYKEDPYFVGVFATPEDFKRHAVENWIGFKCPNCGSIGNDPTQCKHRAANDRKCDWCASGLFQSEWFIIVRSIRYSRIPIFEPVAKDGGAE